MKCEIENFLAVSTQLPRNRYSATDGETVVQTRCKTHLWDWPQGAAAHVGDSCPIGRIELATEEALAKIERAQRSPEPR